jgi:phospholipid N-methyltransferase
MKMKLCGIWLRELWRSYGTTGAIAPSSVRLARTITAPVAAAVRSRRGAAGPERAGQLASGAIARAATACSSWAATAGSTGPLRVLEVGPGTGAFTAELVRLLGPEDELTLVELNPAFVAALEKRFETEPAFRRISERVRIVQLPVQDMGADQPYDFVISGLPLNSFSPADVRAILRKLKRLVAPAGTLSFFEYLWIRRMKEVVSSGGQRRRVRKVERIIEHYLYRYEARRDIVLANLPPAVVHHLQFA